MTGQTGTAQKLPKNKRIRLPFEQRRKDPATWAYEHRVGIYCMVIAYLIFGIAFMTAKVVVSKRNLVSTMIVDFSDLEEIMRQQEMTPEQRQQIQEEFGRAMNRVSNENAGEQSDGSGRVWQNAEIEGQRQATADRLAAGRQAYEQGVQRAEDILNAPGDASRTDNSSGNDRQDVRIAGKVTISYDLEGRTAVDLYNPAYRCEEGGRVMVSVKVNRNGVVTAASAIKSSSDNDPCLIGMAEMAARRSRFNTSASAPDPQQGTITYEFQRQ